MLTQQSGLPAARGAHQGRHLPRIKVARHLLQQRNVHLLVMVTLHRVGQLLHTQDNCSTGQREAIFGAASQAVSQHAQAQCWTPHRLLALKVMRMPPFSKPDADSRLSWDELRDVGMTLLRDSLISAPLFGSKLYFCLQLKISYILLMLRSNRNHCPGASAVHRSSDKPLPLSMERSGWT